MAARPLSACHWEFEGYVGEDGNGWITHQVITDALGVEGCFASPCIEEVDDQRPWPFGIREEAGLEILRTTFCVNNVDCTIDVRIIQTDHHYNFRAEDSLCLEEPASKSPAAGKANPHQTKPTRPKPKSFASNYSRLLTRALEGSPKWRALWSVSQPPRS